MDELTIYSRLLFAKIWQKWMHSAPIITLGGFMFGLFVDMRLYIGCIFVLVIIDMITGIAASLHRGERFSSKKLKVGLIDRIILYGMLLIITLMLDTILRGTVNYGRDYIAIACSTIIGFYEGSSCIENLISRFPKYTFLQRLGKMLNIIEQKYEENTVNKVSDAMETTKILRHDSK